MQKIDTILFDLDGTLINSNELIIKVFEETFKQYMPKRSFSRQEFVDMIGPPLKETFKIATDSPSRIQEMIDYYRKIYIALEFDYIDIYPNTILMLETFQKLNVNLGLVTTKFKESAMTSITAYGLDKYITSFCFLDDIKEHKPHPEPIFYALNQFAHYQKVVMVGDSASDIMAGFNSGCLTCGVDWSIKKDSIKSLNPDFWIKDFLDLVDIVKNFNKED